MAKEIEKKFLVHAKQLPTLQNGKLYKQGYLCQKPLIRYRAVGNAVIITIKNVDVGGVNRDEFEFSNELSNEEIDKLTTLSIKKPIEKIRYKVEFGGLIWEIDVYQGENEGLMTADIELPNENHVINFPEWIDKDVEITNDPKYFNVNLGDNPYKSWSKD